MNLIVQKYGGTSVGTIERIKSVAKRIKNSSISSKLVIVVSAMSGYTDRLINYADSVDSHEGSREYDFITSSGEQISAGLLSAALNSCGVKSRSYCGWQVPIITDNSFGQANIIDINTDLLKENLQNGIVSIICGFQGVTKAQSSITTIGRGGSDLTAVALADHLSADICEIYSDVDGVYSSDPNVVSRAQILSILSYDEMLELSLNGAKVLQTRAVDYASRRNIKIRAASSFIDSSGTIISSDATPSNVITGIGMIRDLISIRFPNSERNNVENALRRNHIKLVDIQDIDFDCKIKINHQDSRIALRIINEFTDNVEFSPNQYSNICIVGINLGNNVKVADKISKMENIHKTTLLKNSINLLVPKQKASSILNALHKNLIDQGSNIL